MRYGAKYNAFDYRKIIRYWQQRTNRKLLPYGSHGSSFGCGYQTSRLRLEKSMYKSSYIPALTVS